MAIISFSSSEENTYDLAWLKQLAEKMEAVIAALDNKEPRSTKSEAYEAWADAHEEAEDLLDEIRDHMDDLSDGETDEDGEDLEEEAAAFLEDIQEMLS